MRIPFAIDSLWFVLPLTVAMTIAYISGFLTIAVLILGIIIFVLYFFRDPIRIATTDPNQILAPADGKVIKIDSNYESEDYGKRGICISIFLSIFNVHIQRVPVDGVVNDIRYNKGKFLAAWDHKASLDNEQSMIKISTDSGMVVVKQIAGLIARRIKTYLKIDEKVLKGSKLGLIRFGSRVDLILPPDYVVVSKIGDKVVGAKTVMARVK
ncbi:MAG: phosphatidylserine decarboxylase family protein [Nitrospinota bacterium]